VIPRPIRGGHDFRTGAQFYPPSENLHPRRIMTTWRSMLGNHHRGARGGGDVRAGARTKSIGRKICLPIFLCCCDKTRSPESCGWENANNLAPRGIHPCTVVVRGELPLKTSSGGGVTLFSGFMMREPCTSGAMPGRTLPRSDSAVEKVVELPEPSGFHPRQPEQGERQCATEAVF
jgi:hypothetical protein